MLTFVSFVLVFGTLIFIHELGHFAVAKWCGVKVHEFAMGMGPKVVGMTRGETTYSLRLFPIGGFVRMAGEEPGDEDDPRGFDKRPVLARMAIVGAGPLMNFLLALLLFILVFMFMGVPSDQPIIGFVENGFPAAEAGLHTGDRVLAVDGLPMTQWAELVAQINASPEKPLVLTILRDGETLNITVVPRFDQEGNRGIIGISGVTERFALFESIAKGFEQTVWVTKMMVLGIVEAIVDRTAPDVAGPVGIVSMVGEVARVGIANLVWLAAFLSINLGFINLIPVPALDGGRLLFMGIEVVRGRPIDPQKEGFIHFVGFVILLLLIGFVTYKDIVNLLGGGRF